MMQILCVIVIVAITVFLAYWFKKQEQPTASATGAGKPVPVGSQAGKKEESSTEGDAKNEEDASKRYAGMKSYALVMTITKELGCQPVADEEDEERIHFTYQGENFMIDTQKEGLFVCLYDTWWYEVSLSDLDEYSDARRAVNACNFNYATSLVYTINEEENQMGIHCRSVFLLTAEIPNISDYFRSRLQDCFLQHRNFHQKLDELRKKRVTQAT